MPTTISHNDSKKILDTSRTDLENMLLLQGQFCSRRLLQMSTVFTHDAREQALLQGPKALEFVKTLHRLYYLLHGVLIQSNHIVPPEVFIENRYTYKQQEDYYVLMVILTMTTMTMTITMTMTFPPQHQQLLQPTYSSH